MKRSETLRSLKDTPDIDVLVIGAGVNGIATFRDLAINGVNTLIVDRGDFVSGASAASSHMAHGGIRYLENGEFGLVREAVQERNRMIENAPHIVRPLPTTIPIFRIFSGILNAPLKFLNLLDRPSERGALVIKIGLIFYDTFTRKQKTVPSHRFENRTVALKRFPALNAAIKYAATYYDGAIMEPERLATEMLIDTEADQPNARALNYVSVVGGKLNFVTLQDEITGEQFDVRPRLVINAAGPWIDATNKALGLSTRLIGGTKGSHLVINNPELRAAIANNEFFFENKDGRIVLLYPLYDKVLVGTSDLPIEDADAARCTPEETKYFLEMVKVVFPEIEITPENIVYQFSGVRPLEYSGAKTTGQISRDHTIQVLNGVWTGQTYPIYSLVGGKWTSFRAFAEEVTDKSLDYLEMERTRDTRELKIGGGRNYERRQSERTQKLSAITAWTDLGLGRLEQLYERYGSRVEDVAMFISQGSDKPLKNLVEYSEREIGFLVTREKVIHLDDLILRRTHIAKLGMLTHPLLKELNELTATFLEWDTERKSAEIQRTMQILADRHGIEF
jgi:glycerol-3-phosphate dehydrogenase